MVKVDRQTFVTLVLICAGLVTPLSAQTAAPVNQWSRGTTVEAMAGIGTASSDTGALVGGAIGWELTPRFGLDGSAAWVDRHGGGEAFSAAVTAHVSLAAPGKVVPFARAGLGLYRMSVDASSVDDSLEFYRRRLGPNIGRLSRRTFTDPAFVLGGGVNVFVTRQLAFGPELGVIVVRAGGHGHVVTTVTMHLTYHIEEHPITPAGRARRHPRGLLSHFSRGAR